MSPSVTHYYESFLLNNVSTISSLESSLRSVTWFLPGRFKDAELASEALSASLNLMGMYHDTVLAKIIRSDPKYKPLLPETPHTRFTRIWSEKDAFYKWSGRVLEMIRYTELLVEMGLRRKVSQKNRWRGVVILEAIKTVLRLMLLRVTKRPLLTPLIPERDFDPATLPPSSTASSPTLAPSSPPSSPPATPDHLKNNHMPLLPHPLLTLSPPTVSDTSVEDYLLPKALTTTFVRPALSLVRAFSMPQEWLAEFIYILRPLVYAVLLNSSRGTKSNRPLYTVLAMELFSRTIRRNATVSATLERAEYARRDRDMLWYLLRGSIWQSYTRPKLESLVDTASRKPLLGLFGSLVKDWIPLIDEYYYYTAP